MRYAVEDEPDEPSIDVFAADLLDSTSDALYVLPPASCASSAPRT